MGKFGIVTKDKTEYTVEMLKDRFPQKAGTITQELADMINAANNDASFNGDEFVEHMLTYKNVMLDGSGSMKDYVNSLKFCAYLEVYDDNVTEAYRRARANDAFVIARENVATDSAEYRELTSAAARFRKSVMVRKILAQSDMPLHLMFQGGRMQMASVLLNEAMSAPYSKDRISAADKFLTHVKPPENTKIELEVGLNEEAKNIQQDLMRQIALAVESQKEQITRGVDIKQAQKLGININEVQDAEIIDE